MGAMVECTIPITIVWKNAMSAVAEETITLPSLAEPRLLKSIMDAVQNALVMCDAQARCVGISSVPSRDPSPITGLIGVHGKVSGFLTVNMAEKSAIRLVEGLLGEKFNTLTSQVVDGAGEITNIIVGGIKSTLAGSTWAFSHITVPSVIIGRGYQIAYAKGLDFVCATFERTDPEAILLEDRLFHVSVSLLRL
jgi:chemotaxis protein CheX